LRIEFRVSRRGPRNCRSLGFARDDKGKSDVSMESGCWTEAFLITSGGHRPVTTPVELTILFEDRVPGFQGKYETSAATELSSRPERSVVERSAVSLRF
jgi:hypothetical protein